MDHVLRCAGPAQLVQLRECYDEVSRHLCREPGPEDAIHQALDIRGLLPHLFLIVCGQIGCSARFDHTPHSIEGSMMPWFWRSVKVQFTHRKLVRYCVHSGVGGDVDA